MDEIDSSRLRVGRVRLPLAYLWNSKYLTLEIMTFVI